jgi:hypothetical protein
MLRVTLKPYVLSVFMPNVITRSVLAHFALPFDTGRLLAYPQILD